MSAQLFCPNWWLCIRLLGQIVILKTCVSGADECEVSGPSQVQAHQYTVSSPSAYPQFKSKLCSGFVKSSSKAQLPIVAQEPNTQTRRTETRYNSHHYHNSSALYLAPSPETPKPLRANSPCSRTSSSNSRIRNAGTPQTTPPSPITNPKRRSPSPYRPLTALRPSPAK